VVFCTLNADILDPNLGRYLSTVNGDSRTDITISRRVVVVIEQGYPGERSLLVNGIHGIEYPVISDIDDLRGIRRAKSLRNDEHRVIYGSGSPLVKI
jgi:hypothetical protein